MTDDVDVHQFVEGTIKVEPGKQEVGLTEEGKKSVNHVVDLLSRRQIPSKEVRRIMLAMREYEVGGDLGEEAQEEEAYDENFDMQKEIAEVLRSVRLLRKSIMSPSGKALKAGVTPGEAKDVISMSNSMINTLMKSHEKVVNMSRYRAVEQATVDILRELDGQEELIQKLVDFRDAGAKGDGPLTSAFLDALEQRLEAN